MKKRLLAILLALSLCISLFGCTELFKPINDNNDQTDAGPGELVFPEGEEKLPEKWDDGVLVPSDAYSVQLAVGGTARLSDYIGAAEGLLWRSECEAIAAVENGVASAHKVGRTEIYAMAGDSVRAKFVVTVENPIQSTGFDFTTTLADEEEYKVESLREANEILDIAAANHIKTVKIDFSAISTTFNVKTDFVLNSEFGSHTSLKMMFYPSTPYKVEFEIIYNKDAASYTTPATEEYTYESVQSANAIIRTYYAAQGEARADDFEGFAINSRKESFPVYNSEELWWAVEHGYKPLFPKKGTKAELFYERAKMILRDIITEDMTEYEKTLAIYEYLITAVSYDYDAYFNPASADLEKNNTCYYLEGVFEEGRAVCDGKSKAFVLLAGIEGIDCVRAFGSQRSGSVGHAWNYVELSGVWYLVDTTDGDERYEAESAISEFFGGQLEAVGYGSFLLPAYTHYEKYEYTDMWAHLIPADKNYAYGTDYFDYDPGEDGYDFIINSSAEVKALLDAITGVGMPEKFILTFKPYSSFKLNSYFYGVESAYGVDMELYKTSESTYIAVFKQT